MITLDGLTKRYGAYTAVDDVSFTVEPGNVTGYLGPNGAGKSTSMRMIVGLTPPTAGHATVLGRPYKEIPNPGLHVGVLLDASAQHNGRTGREVLALSAMLMGLPTKRVDAMLEMVGLNAAESKRRVGNYSLGMRQRLGIAHALLGDPEVLILDEPANGLDPAGIHWMRGLLRDFANRGGTVLLSSHLLHEIEVIADELVVIGRGKIVAQGSKESLLESSGMFVRALDDEQLAGALSNAGIEFTRVAKGGFNTHAGAEDVGRAAAGAGVVLLELRTADGAGLEDMFLTLTADDAREAVTT
ncbi:MAG: ATP-binding cassette domain-containing protein [Actinomycetota bacterium]|nr:ATP-binding cassette domain-containing protein [Actinomycetota bacterium]